MIKIFTTVLLLLFSVPAFAEPSVTTGWQIVSETGNIALNTLIAKLNSEVDRVNDNNSWEDVDGMTNQGWEYVFWMLHPIDIESSSNEEIDQYIAYHFALIDGLIEYIQTIPQNDINRRAFFESAVAYIQEWMTAD